MISKISEAHINLVFDHILRSYVSFKVNIQNPFFIKYTIYGIKCHIPFFLRRMLGYIVD